MTELQLGLIGLGGVAVVGVFAYNQWQEYRYRKLAEAVFEQPRDDVLLGDGAKVKPPADGIERSEPEMRGEEAPALEERVEPVFNNVPYSEPYPSETGEEEKIESPSVAEAAPEPVFATPVFAAPDEDDNAPDIEPGPLPNSLLDPRLEFIVAIELVEPVPAAQLMHAQRDALHRLNKPVHWVGFNERSREWERLVAGSDLPVRRLRVGLQLVNRLGPVSEGDVVIFTNAMRALADELMAVADMPSARVLDQAAEIDRFCAAVDLEIGVNLVSRASAFSGTKIRALAEAAGMHLGSNGMFNRHDDEGHLLFSLQNYESTQFSADALRTLTTHGLTFILDVPCVAHGERVFGQMTELAKRFADTLQGALVDDNRQPLSDSQLDHIRREFIGKPQATMLSFGLSAGSPQALRLFS